MSLPNLARRDFLKALGVTGGGLLMGISLSACAQTSQVLYAQDSDLQPDGLIQVTAAGEIIFYLARTEMGQGITTGLASLVAEELNMQPQDLVVRHAGVHPDYINPEFGMQGTGGSSSIRAHYIPLRESAARVRVLLLSAAAQVLGVEASQLELKDKRILSNGKPYSLAGFVAAASQLPIPVKVNLKQPKDFTVIGKNQKRVDALAKVTGQATFGIDVGHHTPRQLPSVINDSDRSIPNLKKAALLRCPVIGGEVRSFNGAEVKALPGVQAVVEIFNGVAVVADHYWQAKSAAAKLVVDWRLPELAEHSSDSIKQQFIEGFNESGQEAFKSGKGSEGLAEAASMDGAKVLEAEYHVPYLAHATMEPMNCTVWLRTENEKEICDVWVPSQFADISQQIAAEYSGLANDDITVHTTYLGGGFGRRCNQDYVAEAISIAKATGMAVQLLFSREDDMRNDFYRPASSAKMRGAITAEGKLHSWDVTRVGPNIMGYTVDEVAGLMLPDFLPAGMVDWISKRGYGVFENWTVDPSSVEGLSESYDCDNKEVRQVTIDPGLRLGFWRSVGHSFSGFFAESFMDELALAATKDPLEFRLQHCNNNPRLAAVLKKVAAMANWQDGPKPGRFLGIAAAPSFNSFVAEVAEVSVQAGKIKVHKVYCAVDCGRAINPNIVAAQMESSIIFGLSAALMGEITLEQGAVQQSNFHDYPVIRMSESPDIEVAIIPSEEPPSGVGEPGLPPLAPAVANAVFAASGQRLRELPLKLSS